MADISVTREHHSASQPGTTGKESGKYRGQLYELPNKMEIAYQSRVELAHFYEDIFEKQVYLQHGITLNEGDCVFDVGANIGLFTLFVSQNYRDVALYSFEPAPPLFEILSANASWHAPAARLFNCGLSSESRDAAFTFYPNSSGMSSFYGDEREEKEVLRSIMRNQLDQGMAGMKAVIEYADDILEERLKHQTFTCHLETLSNIIREQQVERIDLLKIDVQKCELEVVQGIDEDHWQIIKQIVIEVHDFDGRLEEIMAQLKSHDYQVTVKQDQMYKGSLMYNLYAVRSTPAVDSFFPTVSQNAARQAPARMPSSDSRPSQLLVLSGKSEEELERTTNDLATHLREHPEENFADLAYTLQTGRKRFAHRRMLVCQDPADGLAVLETRNPRRVFTIVAPVSPRSVAFMFSGLGNHYVNMAHELYQTETVFRQAVAHCCELLKPHLGLDLREVLYPAGKESGLISPPADLAHSKNGGGLDLRRMLRRGEPADEAAARLNQSLFSQPALFVVEYALAQLWMSWGIYPDAMIGYSIGEYVAACVAEVFSLEDALMLVAKRARMIQGLPGGAMLAVPLSEEQVQPLLNQQLALSASNGPDISVVGGPTEAITELQRRLTEQGLACQRLQVVHAFHSKMMSPIVGLFTEMTKGLKLNPPKIPYLSNVTGDWITADQARDPKYWGEHLCQPVRFADGVQKLWRQPGRMLLEVGPGQSLCAWAMQQPENGVAVQRVALPSLRHSYEQQPDASYLLQTLGRLWLAGVPIDWSGFYAQERRHRISLPAYPFDLQRRWIDPQKSASGFRTLAASETRPAGDEEERMKDLDQTGSRRFLPTPYVAARNGLEEKLSEVWHQVLDADQIGIYDNFFALGGDSIKATQLITRVKETFHATLSLRDFFNSPTVADLAMMVVQSQAERADSEALAQVLREIKQLSQNDAAPTPPADGLAE
jgi:FkbM family methyltransferase